MKKSLFGQISLLVGTVVGAGIFGIPYVVSRAGFGIGLIFIVVLGVVNLVTTLALGEISARTQGGHQITFLAEKYLGPWGRRVTAFSVIFGIYGALLAYLIGVGDFSLALLGPYIGGTSFIYTCVFFVLASIALLIGIKVVVRVEKVMVGLLLVAVGLIFLIGSGSIKFDNLLIFSLPEALLPYGVVLFAFGGFTAVPEMLRAGERKDLKKAILAGMFIPFGLYIIFSLTVVGISGTGTTPEAIVGLGNVLGEPVLIIGAVLGILTMTTSFLSLGLVLRSVLERDYNLRPALGWVLTCLIPLAAFLLGFNSFIEVIGLVGAVMGGIQGVIVLIMLGKARARGEQKSPYRLKFPMIWRYIVSIFFIAGIVAEVYYFLIRE